MLTKFATIIAMAIGLTVTAQRYNVKSIEWSGGNFDLSGETTSEDVHKSHGNYISKNVIATRGVIYKDEAIVTLPRFKSGVPATLAKMSLKNKYGVQPILEAYPSWSLQEVDNCAALQSAIDVFLDHRGILWVLDIGIVNSLEKPNFTCSPKVVAINVKTEKIVTVIELDSMATSESRLQYVLAEYSDDNRVFVYITDAASRSIIIYDVTSDHQYRMVLPDVVTEGCDQPDVLYAVLLRRPDGSACIVFTYLGSQKIFSVRTRHLQNATSHGKIQELGEKPKKMVLLGTDNGSSMFFRYEGESDVYRWDTEESFLARNFRKIFDGDMCSITTQVMTDMRRGRMRLLQSNFPDFVRGTVGCGPQNAIVPI